LASGALARVVGGLLLENNVNRRRAFFLLIAIIGMLAFALLLVGQALRSAPQSSLAGIVVSGSTGKPIAGVVARMMIGGPEVTTDTSGRFTLTPEQPGNITVTFARPGYMLRRATYEVKPGIAAGDVRVSLQEVGIVSGRVFDSRGRPVPQIVVSPLFYRTGEDGLSELVAGDRTTTDDRGEFRLTDVPPGHYLINFSSGTQFSGTFPQAPALDRPMPGSIPPVLYPGVPEIRNATWATAGPGEETRLQNVVLSETRFGAIRVHVENPSGEPDKDVILECCVPPPSISNKSGQREGSLSFLDSTQTTHLNRGDRMSRLYWPNQPGLYRFTASWRTPDGVLDVSTDIDFTGTDVEVSVILAKPEGRLRINLTQLTASGGRVPLERISINLGRPPLRFAMRRDSKMSFSDLSRGSRLQPSLVQRTGRDGDAVFDLLPPGLYDLRQLDGLPANTYLVGARQGSRNIVTDSILVSNEGWSLVELQVKSGAGKVRGTVSEGATLIQDALVTLMPEPATLEKEMFRRRVGRTDQFGVFELNGIVPGLYRVIAWSPQEYPNAFDVFPAPNLFAESTGPEAATIRVRENDQIGIRLVLPSSRR